MLKKTITYENLFTGQTVTEDHYFHISKADLVEMELEELNQSYTNKEGEELSGLQAKLARIVDSEDGKGILAEFKGIIKRAYGLKDGDRFRKSQEISDDFASSEAFSQLLFELATDPGEAAAFVNNIIPANMEEIAAEVKAQAEKIADGRAAQERAKLAAVPEGGTPSDAATRDALDRNAEIMRATPENPVTLTAVEVQSMENEQLKAGIADGRYKFA